MDGDQDCDTYIICKCHGLNAEGCIGPEHTGVFFFKKRACLTTAPACMARINLNAVRTYLRVTLLMHHRRCARRTRKSQIFLSVAPSCPMAPSLQPAPPAAYQADRPSAVPWCNLLLENGGAPRHSWHLYAISCAVRTPCTAQASRAVPHTATPPTAA